MTVQEQQNNTSTQATEARLRSSAAVADWLLRLSMTQRADLKTEAVDYWDQQLCHYPSEAIEYAFSKWEKVGKVFPKPGHIHDLIAEWSQTDKANLLPPYQPCGQNGCYEGWLVMYAGRTVGGHPIDQKTGAMKRCECWHQWRRSVA